VLFRSDSQLSITTYTHCCPRPMAGASGGCCDGKLHALQLQGAPGQGSWPGSGLLTRAAGTWGTSMPGNERVLLPTAIWSAAACTAQLQAESVSENVAPSASEQGDHGSVGVPGAGSMVAGRLAPRQGRAQSHRAATGAWQQVAWKRQGRAQSRTARSVHPKRFRAQRATSVTGGQP